MRGRTSLSWILAVAAVGGCVSGGDPGEAGRSARSAPAPDAPTIAGYSAATPERLAAAGWRTDLARLRVPLESIRTCDLPRDAIVPIVHPRHVPAERAGLDRAEPVLVVRGRSEVRAWPLAHLRTRELALDDADGEPVAVTFCSVCGTARVWSRRVAGRTLDLGVSGMLLEGNSLLYDRGTETLWRQRDGRAVAGELAGEAMTGVPAFVVSFGALADAHPDAVVMDAPASAPDPPFRTFTGAEVASGRPPAWLGTTCPRPLEPVLAAGGAEPWPVAGAAVEQQGDRVVFRDPATGTPYRDADGGPSLPAGSAAAFLRDLDGRRLTFRVVPARFPEVRDDETGSRWNALGEAVEGPLAGRSLVPAEQMAGFRFAYRPGDIR